MRLLVLVMRMSMACASGGCGGTGEEDAFQDGGISGGRAATHDCGRVASVRRG